MSAHDHIIDIIIDYWSEAAVIGGGGALWRWLRYRPDPSSPRRYRQLLLYLTAIKEYETAMATALYWQAEAETERQNTQRWKARYEECRSELLEITTQQLPADQGRDSAGGSG